MGTNLCTMDTSLEKRRYDTILLRPTPSDNAKRGRPLCMYGQALVTTPQHYIILSMPRTMRRRFLVQNMIVNLNDNGICLYTTLCNELTTCFNTVLLRGGPLTTTTTTTTSSWSSCTMINKNSP